MNITISSSRDAFLDKIYKKSMRELEKFYGFRWTHHKPVLATVKDRKTIDLLRGWKTEEWLVGWINMNTRIVYLLDRKNLEKESSHKYRPDSYSRLIKHELSHCFQMVISKSIIKTDWLWEGLAGYTSGQNAEKKRPDKFKSFLDFYEKSGAGVYAESGFAVQLLVERFGKRKLFNLIKMIKKNDTKSKFSKYFKKFYGFEPNYKEFNRIWGVKD